MKYNVTNVSSRPNPMSSSKNHKNIRQSPCLIVKSAISIQTVRINKSVIFKKYIKPLDMLVTSVSLQQTKESTSAAT